MGGSAVAKRLGATVAAQSAAITEPGRLYRKFDGIRDEHGVFHPGAFQRINVRLTHIPITGQQRMTLEEALREQEVARFILSPAVTSIGPASEGDAIYHERRVYRVHAASDWGGFRDLMTVLPFSGDIGDTEEVRGAFSEAFGFGYDTILQDALQP